MDLTRPLIVATIWTTYDPEGRNIFMGYCKGSSGGTMRTQDIDPSLYLRWNDSCIWRPADDGIFILQINPQFTEQGSVGGHMVRHITLNREGKDTWMLCAGDKTVRDIIEILQEEYEGEKEVIQKDITTFITNLCEEKYVIVQESPDVVSRGPDNNAYPVRIDDAIANVVEDNFIIMNMKTSEVHSFDKHVETLWDICDGTRTVGDILSAAANRDEAAFLLDFLIRLGFLILRHEKD